MSDGKILVNIDPDLEELIPGFLKNRSKDLTTLQNAMDAADYQAIQSIGHSLKGVGGGYGFDVMSKIGADIEISARAQEHDTLIELIESYEKYLDCIEVVFE